MNKKARQTLSRSTGYQTMSLSNGSRFSTLSKGFTIVELLVVKVVIAILAAITIVAYTGISQKAITASLQLDLSNASKQLKLFQVDNGAYPTTISTNCTTTPTTSVPPTNLCLKVSSGNSYGASYTAVNNTNPQTFTLTDTNTSSSIVYSITNISSPLVASASLAVSDPANWLVVGTQTWAKYNLNTGNMITGVTAQTNNSTPEKYCYADTLANCTTYGGLYQWDEAMQYVTTAGAQGICPAGSHIPTDNEYKTLEMQLGMTQAQADLDNTWRGTTEGTQLKSGNPPGLNVPLAGRRDTGGYFASLSSLASLWSSSESSISAWRRTLSSGYPTVSRISLDKGYGFSVRCLGN